MLNEDDLLGKEKPFRMREYILPGILDFVEQLEFLRTAFPTPDLIYFAKLPFQFETPEFSSEVLDQYNSSCIKLRTLLELLQTADAQNLFDSISQGVSIYRSMHPEDYQGLEVLFIDGTLILSIFNGDNLALQVVMENIAGNWHIFKLMHHFEYCGYNIEIRSNLQGGEIVIINPPNENLAVVPTVRDSTAIATIRIPNQSYDEWSISLVNTTKLAAENAILHDYFTIVPGRKRVIEIRTEAGITEQIVIYPSDFGVSISNLKRTTVTLPDGQIEVMTRYQVILEAGIDIDAIRARNLVSDNKNLDCRSSIIKKRESKLPKSTKIEYFKSSGISSFEVRFKDDMTIDAIVVNDKVYIDGEFTQFFSEEGYYVFVLGDTSARIPVNFNLDYSMHIPDNFIKPVFTAIDSSIGLPLSVATGLGRIVSLN